MIQDIYPEHLENSYRDILPGEKDRVLTFDHGKVAVRHEEEQLIFPTYGELAEVPCVYAFTIADHLYFLALDDVDAPGYARYSLQELRALKLNGNQDIFAVYTGFHLWKWDRDNRFCGACGHALEYVHDERAKCCPVCKNRVYPRINPAVIVGVINGEKLLLTKYKTGFRHNALVAGFTEIGETAEQTVEREVMEEVGLHVKNIRSYKSQPWGIAADLLMGFYCEVDGDDHILRDDHELGYAEWVTREDIVLQPSDYSLTNEMMKRFKEGKIKADS